MKTIYRVQDKDGRGPWKPGFSDKWVREEPDYSLLPFVFTMSPGQLKPDYGETRGCGCLTKEQLKQWFNEAEYRKLLGFGYSSVEMKVGRILGKDRNQCVFARREPLNWGAIEFELYPEEVPER